VPWQLTVRASHRVEHVRFDALDEALSALEARGRAVAGAVHPGDLTAGHVGNGQHGVPDRPAVPGPHPRGDDAVSLISVRCGHHASGCLRTGSWLCGLPGAIRIV